MTFSAPSSSPTLRQRWIATPYGLRESLGVLRRNLLGVDRRQPAGIGAALPRRARFLPAAAVSTRIAFVGDIMSMGQRRLTIDPALGDRLKSCDWLVGNFEATVTEARWRRGVLFGAFQPQPLSFLDTLARLFPPPRTLLSLANNHAGDYPPSVFQDSRRVLEDRGFRTFGHAGRPGVEVDGMARIAAGTMWSNQPCAAVPSLEQALAWSQATAGTVPEAARRIDILYPHWGYELELFPRPGMVARAEALTAQYDAIVGHHSHTVQPVVSRPGRHDQALIAYSLGNLVTALGNPAYGFGLLLVLGLARSPDGRPCIAEAAWDVLRCRHLSRRESLLEVVERPVYR